MNAKDIFPMVKCLDHRQNSVHVETPWPLNAFAEIKMLVFQCADILEPQSMQVGTSCRFGCSSYLVSSSTLLQDAESDVSDTANSC